MTHDLYRQAQETALEVLIQALESMGKIQGDVLSFEPEKLDLTSEVVRTVTETLQHLFWLQTWQEARSRFGPGVFWGLVLKSQEGSTAGLLLPFVERSEGV